MYIYSNSTLQTISGIDYIYLNEKTSYETGYAFGRLLVESKNRLVRLVKNPIIKLFLYGGALITTHLLKRVFVPGEYLEELRGLADATGIPFRILCLLNCSFDISKKAGVYCSSWSFFNKEGTLVGRNTDFRPSIARIILKYARPLIVTISIPGKHVFTNIAFPLSIGVLNGFNWSGVVVNAHQVLTLDDVTRDRTLATIMLMRKILEESENINQVEKIILGNLPCRALNLMMTIGRDRVAKVFEIKPMSYNVIHNPDTNYLCCTTYFQSEGEEGSKTKKRSVARLRRMNELMQDRESMTIDDGIKFLQDSHDDMKYIHSGKSITNDGTFQSFIFDVGERVIYISNSRTLPVSLNGEYVKITI